MMPYCLIYCLLQVFFLFCICVMFEICVCLQVVTGQEDAVITQRKSETG